MSVDVAKREVVLLTILEWLDENGIVATEKTTFKFLDLKVGQIFLLADVLSKEFGCDYIDFNSMVTVGDLVDFVVEG